MRLHKFSLRIGRIPTTIIRLLAYTLILVLLLVGLDTASAHSAAETPTETFGQRMPEHAGSTAAVPATHQDTAPAQVAPAADTSLGRLSLTAGGATVALTSAFDAEGTRYEATVNAERVDVRSYATRSAATIDLITVGRDIVFQDPPSNLLSTTVTC